MILRIKFNPIAGKIVIAILGATSGLSGANPHSALLRYASLRAFPFNPWRWISMVAALSNKRSELFLCRFYGFSIIENCASHSVLSAAVGQIVREFIWKPGLKSWS
jgi:hypothetical protein